MGVSSSGNSKRNVLGNHRRVERGKENIIIQRNTVFSTTRWQATMEIASNEFTRMEGNTVHFYKCVADNDTQSIEYRYIHA